MELTEFEKHIISQTSRNFDIPIKRSPKFDIFKILPRVESSRVSSQVLVNIESSKIPEIRTYREHKIPE
jgi:hypothetical protein